MVFGERETREGNEKIKAYIQSIQSIIINPIAEEANCIKQGNTVGEQHPQKLQHFWLAFLEGLKSAFFEDESHTCSDTGKACSLQTIFLYHPNKINAKALLSLPFSYFFFYFLFAEQ